MNKEHPITHSSLLIPHSSLLIVTCSLLIAACYYDYEPDPNTKITAYGLQGTWKSNDYDNAVYRGTLIITYNRITINGYSEDQTPPLANDSNRPFRTFTKGVPLKAYTEEGQIYIEDGGALQTGIPYTQWDDYPPPDYKRRQFLRFTFGNRQETLEKENLR